jgi:formamidopyrimidine-DNA glycosylase
VPELPEVETVRRGLALQVDRFLVDRVEVLRSRAILAPAGDDAGFAAALVGCRPGPWRRRGKYLLADLQRHDRPAGVLGCHLRMTGQFRWLTADGPPPCSHTRVRFLGRQDGAPRELRFVDLRSFGTLWHVPAGVPEEKVITGLARLGPEPLGPEFTAEHLRRRLRGSGRPIKSALLDQGLVAGVGNIYADEALFLAGIRPQTPAGRLRPEALERLRAELVAVLETSIGAGGTTFSDFRDLTGTNGNYGGAAWVYRRSGTPCRRCGTLLRRDRLGGRSSHWCPTCQA